MYMNDSEQCGTQEICDLGDHYDPKDALVQFCRLNLQTCNSPKYGCVGNYTGGAQSTLFCYYLFTAPVYGDVEGNYGVKFAKFIKANKLGKVVTGGAIPNKTFHPDHKNQAWLWVPNEEALRAWYEANGGGK